MQDPDDVYARPVALPGPKNLPLPLEIWLGSFQPQLAESLPWLLSSHPEAELQDSGYYPAD